MEALEQKIIYRYKDLGYGLIKTGQPFGLSQGKVKKILQKNGIKIRSFSQAAIKSNKNRSIGINHFYFDEESSNMAYILGLWASDGTVRKDSNEMKLTLQENDSEILEKIAQELEYKGSIKHYITKTGYKNATLTFTSERIKKKFTEYGIIPQKTFHFVFPIHLEKKYWIDFIRGYFDGDGTISTAGASAIRFQICSAIEETLAIIVDFLDKEYNIPPVLIQLRTDGLYYFQYSTTATKMIYKILYTPSSLYLKRKYEKFKSFCE